MHTDPPAINSTFSSFYFSLYSSEAPTDPTLLHSVDVESLQSGSLPPTLCQASINVQLKKDKDPDLCTSYRPISLINVDAKILAKALSLRLEVVLPTIISNEQTRFLKGRQLF